MKGDSSNETYFDVYRHSIDILRKQTWPVEETNLYDIRLQNYEYRR